MIKFRDLRADEVDCRVAQATAKGVSVLLYKDARCDMNILDETVGAMNWQRQHCRENANCIVSIWDDQKGQWISKEDTGTESNTEAEKGLASDSFKRACFNWGIGRELYTAPFVWIKAADCASLKQADNGKWKCYDRFEVETMKVKDKKIVELTITNNGKRVFAWWLKPVADLSGAQPFVAPTNVLTLDQRDEILRLCEVTGTELDKIKARYKVEKLDDMTPANAAKAIEILTKMVKDKEAANAGEG